MSRPALFLLYSRPGCHLCEQLQDELSGLLAGGPHGIQVVDVDADRDARVRWGHKIPVLMLDGELVCRGVLDPVEVHKALALRL